MPVLLQRGGEVLRFEAPLNAAVQHSTGKQLLSYHEFTLLSDFGVITLPVHTKNLELVCMTEDDVVKEANKALESHKCTQWVERELQKPAR